MMGYDDDEEIVHLKRLVASLSETLANEIETNDWLQDQNIELKRRLESKRNHSVVQTLPLPAEKFHRILWLKDQEIAELKKEQQAG